MTSLDVGGGLLHAALFVAGALLVIETVLSAVRSFVLPRSAQDRLARAVFRTTRALFHAWTRSARSYEDMDARMALYAPLSLLVLPIVWLASAGLGYTAMYRAVGVPSWSDAFDTSGS